MEYNPILAPISQKIELSLLKLSIHSNVSGSFEKKVFTLHSVNWFGIKKFIFFSRIESSL